MYVTFDNALTWTQKQKLLSSDGAQSDWFGCSVAVFNDTIVAGAYRDDDARGFNTGKATSMDCYALYICKDDIGE